MNVTLMRIRWEKVKAPYLLPARPFIVKERNSFRLISRCVGSFADGLRSHHLSRNVGVILQSEVLFGQCNAGTYKNILKEDYLFYFKID